MCFRDTNTFACNHVEIQSFECRDMILLLENPVRKPSGCPNGVEEREKWYNYRCHSCELTPGKLPGAVRKVVEFGREMGATIRAAFSDETEQPEPNRGARKSMVAMMGQFDTIAKHGEGWRIPEGSDNASIGRRVMGKLQGIIGMQKKSDPFSRSLHPPMNLIVKQVDTVETMEDKLRKASVAPGHEDILQKMAKQSKAPGFLEKSVNAAQGVFGFGQNTNPNSILRPFTLNAEEEATLTQMAAVRVVDMPRRRAPRTDLPDRPVSMFMTAEQELEAFIAISPSSKSKSPGVDDRVELTSQRAQQGPGTLQRRTRTECKDCTAKRGGPSKLSSEVTTELTTDEQKTVELGNDLPEIPSQLSQSAPRAAQAGILDPDLAAKFAASKNRLQPGGRGDAEMVSRASSSGHLMLPPIPRRSSKRLRKKTPASMNSEAVAANSFSSAAVSATEVGHGEPIQVAQPVQKTLQAPAQASTARSFTDFSQLEQSTGVDPDEEDDTIRRLREVVGNTANRFEGSSLGRSFFGLFRR